MNRRDFELEVERVVAQIPAEFMHKVENLSFQVEQWADEEILDELGYEDPLDLLGFYRGLPLPERSHDYAGFLPDIILIFQGAVEAYVRHSQEPLSKVIRETIIHELAHYFGFSEEQMDVIEDLWAKGKADG